MIYILATEMIADPTPWAKYGGILGLIIFTMFLGIGLGAKMIVSQFEKLMAIHATERQTWAESDRAARQETSDRFERVCDKQNAVIEKVTTSSNEAVRELSAEIRALNDAVLSRLAGKD